MTELHPSSTTLVRDVDTSAGYGTITSIIIILAVLLVWKYFKK